MSVNYLKLGKEIKRARKEKGWTQAYLAERIDKSEQYISAIENASRQVSLKCILDIAEVLELSLDAIFGLEGRGKTQSLSFWDVLMKDCTPYEKQVMSDIIEAVKLILHNNQQLLQ